MSTTFAVGDLHTGSIPILWSDPKQGDPMSPILFNICIDPLLCKFDELKAGYEIDSQRYVAMSFADDLAVYSDRYRGHCEAMKIIKGIHDCAQRKDVDTGKYGI